MTPADCYDFAKEDNAMRGLCLEFVNDHGCSLDEVAEYFGLTVPSVLVLMDAKKVTQESAEADFEAWALRQKKLTWRSVAGYWKCSPRSAQEILSDLRKKFRRLAAYQRKPRSH